MDWSNKSRQVIASVHSSLPEDATLKQRRDALKAAYPFGERAYWPYKAWCKAQRAYLNQFDPKHQPLTARMMLAGRDDITFLSAS